MDLIVILIVGLFVGAIARFLMPGSDPGGWIGSVGRDAASLVYRPAN